MRNVLLGLVLSMCVFSQTLSGITVSDNVVYIGEAPVKVTWNTTGTIDSVRITMYHPDESSVLKYEAKVANVGEHYIAYDNRWNAQWNVKVEDLISPAINTVYSALGGVEWKSGNTADSLFIWTGASSTDFNDGSNWIGGNVPTSYGQVIIPDSSVLPLLTAAITISELYVDSGATLDLNDNILTIQKTVRNDWIIQDSGGSGALYFNVAATTQMYLA